MRLPWEINKFIGIYNQQNLYLKIYRKAEKLLPRTKGKSFKEECPWKFEPKLYDISSNTYIDGYWQNYKYFENLNPIIFKELTIKEAYTFTVQNILTDIVNDPNSVYIHIPQL